MADELGAVRRTPRPTGDHQTPETAPQESAGTTNTASPVSGDQPAVSSRVSSQVLAIYRSPRSDALAIEREDGEFTCVERHPDGGWRGTGLIEVVPDDWVLARYQLGPECDMEAYAALPPCTACEGGGQDTHGTAFEAPLAVHFAGPPVKAEGRRRQLCMWCGHVISDIPSRKGEDAPHWPQGALVQIEDGITTEVPYDGGELPPGCCALPDDEEPRGYGERVCRRCDVQAAFCPCTKPDVACGKHVPGTSSNRCLLRPGHTSDCSDEFEPEPCTCTENRCDYDDHDNPLTGDECVPCGQRPEGTPCCALDGPDEAQETRAADWPAEEVSGG